MAHLEVERKPARPWWIWVLLAIILIGLAVLLYNKYGTGTTTSKTVTDTTANSNTPIAATGPDWKTVDFNSEVTIDENITDQDIATRGNGTYVIYTLGDNILFPTDGSEITANGQAKLKMISDVLIKRYSGGTIGVFGSTDSKGTASDNKELGKQRAESVKNWLSSNGNVPTENISIQSLGETEPVATNATPDGRHQNRNVAIVVFPKK